MSAPEDRVCPRCGAPHEADQRFCLECGLELPPPGGTLARLRRGWVRRVGWYPGDWIWTTLLALVVAAAGAAVAIWVSSTPTSAAAATTLAATNPSAPPTTASPPAATSSVDTSTLPTPPEPTTSVRTRTRPHPTTTPPPLNGRTPWPAGQSGWTVVLESEPATATGHVRAAAQAQQAARSGLPEVGVLVSSRYASLHPGYYVVFAGVYDSQAQAESTLNAAYAAGFSSAYVRQIAP